MPLLSLDAINTLDEDNFTSVFAGIFEHSPWVARLTWPKRPFRDIDALHAAMCETLRDSSHAEQLALIIAHPDLGDRLGGLTPDSTKEQASAGLDKLTAAELDQFNHSNNAYKTKFGFPFVICARLNDKHTMLAAFASRLQNNREEEFRTALAEIEKIAALRLKTIIATA